MKDDMAEDLLELGRAIGTLVKDPTEFRNILEAWERDDLERIKPVLEKWEIWPRWPDICYWLCMWHCLWRCRFLPR